MDALALALKAVAAVLAVVVEAPALVGACQVVAFSHSQTLGCRSSDSFYICLSRTPQQLAKRPTTVRATLHAPDLVRLLNAIPPA